MEKYPDKKRHLASLLALSIAIVLAIASLPGLTNDSYRPPSSTISCDPVSPESISYNINVRVAGISGEGDMDLEGAEVQVQVSAQNAKLITSDLCELEYVSISKSSGVTDGLGLIEFTTPPILWDDAREAVTIWVTAAKEGYTASSESIEVSYGLNGITTRLVNIRLRAESWTK